SPSNVAFPSMRRALVTVLPLALIRTATASAQPAVTGALNPPLSPRNVSYTITARLDPATRTITGSEVITWRNITTRPAADLQFHLYWNAWKNARSTFMRERALGSTGLGPEVDDRQRHADEWAHIDVTAIKVGGGDLTGV